MRSFVAILLVLVAMPVLAAEEKPDTDETILRALVARQCKAITEEDLDVYDDTLHPDAPNATRTVATLAWLNDSFDVKVTLEKFVMLDTYMDGKRALVFTRIKTEKVRGPKFMDNVARDVYEMRKAKNGRWYMYGTVSNHITPIDKAITFREKLAPIAEIAPPPFRLNK